MLFRPLVRLCVVFLSMGAACADQYDGLTPQQREWRNTAQFYDNWMSDIRNRGGSGSGGAVGMPNYAADIARSQMEWAAGAGERAAERRRQREAALTAARLERERQAAQNAENARFREEFQRLRVQAYQAFRQGGGRGTQEIPPHFSDEAQALQWHLQQAEAGDPYAAFYVGRAHLQAGDKARAAAWLAKADLSDPKAAGLYGALLVRGAGVPRDVERGRQLLEKAASEDTSGSSSWILSSLLFHGAGLPSDPKAAALHLARGIHQADQPGLLESIDMLAPWDERMWERKSRRARMRTELIAWAAARPDLYVSAMEEARIRKWDDAYIVLLSALGELPADPARKAYLQWLDAVETRPTPWDFWARVTAIEGLERRNHPDASARYLLPDAFNRTAGSFIPLEDDKSAALWEKNASVLETWSRGTDALAPRASRALVAREMGRWPQVSKRQSAQSVLDKVRQLNIDHPLDTLSGEVLDGVFTANPQWTDKDSTLAWLDELITLDGSLEPLRGLYLNAPALQHQFFRTDDPIVLALREAQSGTQDFTPKQLDAAESERNAAAQRMYSDPQAAFDGLLTALKGGDALAGWQLLLMAEGRYLNILKQKQSLLDLTDERLQRDAKGEGDRAATAALALHFLHQPNAVGRQWQHGWRVTQPSATNWLAQAEAKGHPWAVFHSADGYDAASRARDNFNPEAQKVWPWLATQYDALSKTELWTRDAALLELFPVERDIESMREPLRAIEWGRTEAARFVDTVSRLASAREILAAYEKEPAGRDQEQAEALYEASSELARQDQSADVLLPRNRVQRLEMLVESSLMGHAFAPLTVGALLKDPGFPLDPQPDEAGRWLEIGKTRLEKVAQKGAPGAAMEAAYLLATELGPGGILPPNNAEAVKQLTLAATLGHARAATTLSNAYSRGELGVAKDAAQQKKWQAHAEGIMMGRYKVPPTALAGRPKDPAPTTSGR